MRDSASSTTVPGGFDFAATHWTTVLAAGEEDSPQADAALEKLCRAYWYPLYAYIRRRGVSAANAEDLTQSFLASLLRRRSLRSVAREKGRFRTFLLAALDHFLADEWDKARALKRGGGHVLISLDEQDADGRYQAEPAAPASAEELFDRRWALAVLDAAMVRLRQDRGRVEVPAASHWRLRQKGFFKCSGQPRMDANTRESMMESNSHGNATGLNEHSGNRDVSRLLAVLPPE